MTVGCRVTQDVLYECFEEEEMLSPDVEIQTGIVEYGLVSFVQNHIKQVLSLYSTYIHYCADLLLSPKKLVLFFMALTILMKCRSKIAHR